MLAKICRISVVYLLPIIVGVIPFLIQVVSLGFLPSSRVGDSLREVEQVERVLARKVPHERQVVGRVRELEKQLERTLLVFFCYIKGSSGSVN